MRPPLYMNRALQITASIESTLAERPVVLPLLNQFPREMVKIVSYGFEIPIIRQPNLSIRTAAHYLCMLSGKTRTPQMPDQERKLFGLLHIGPPANVILLEAELPAEMANYVVAHELGHFVADFLLIRQQWLNQLPDQHADILKAFEWQSYNSALDLHALLHHLPPRPRSILERGPGESLATEARERQADLVARELLAPWRTLAPFAQRYSKDQLNLQLHRDFGLPRRVAREYADDLHRACIPHSDLIDRLFGPVNSPGSADN